MFWSRQFRCFDPCTVSGSLALQGSSDTLALHKRYRFMQENAEDAAGIFLPLFSRLSREQEVSV
jgi:hypothetical protein